MNPPYQHAALLLDNEFVYLYYIAFFQLIQILNKFYSVLFHSRNNLFQIVSKRTSQVLSSQGKFHRGFQES